MFQPFERDASDIKQQKITFGTDASGINKKKSKMRRVQMQRTHDIETSYMLRSKWGNMSTVRKPAINFQEDS